MGHLLFSSRDGLRFARERIRDRGADAAPLLADLIEDRLHEDKEFGSMQNLLQALIGVGDKSHGDLLISVLDTSSVPVIRSTVLEGLRTLGSEKHVPKLIQHAKGELEIAPYQRCIRAIGEIGGSEAAKFLEDTVMQWVDGHLDQARGGQEAWNALLLLEDEGAISRLTQLGPRLGPFYQLQALATRIELGEEGLHAEVRAFLDSATYPSARTRALALRTLAYAGDWDGVLAAAENAEPDLRKNIAESLRDPHAVEHDIGRELLESYVQDSDPNVAAIAVQSLMARGDRSGIEPYLRALSGFPNEPGSVEALMLLKEPDVYDPRTVQTLVRRWPYADVSQRFDLVRALGRLGDAAAVELFEKVLSDPQEDPEIRELVAVHLANLGETAVPVLLAYLQQRLNNNESEKAVSSIARFAKEVPEARALLEDFVLNPQVPDRLRATAMRNLPLVLGEGAFPTLIRGWQEDPREEVRGFLNQVLKTYY